VTNSNYYLSAFRFLLPGNTPLDPLRESIDHIAMTLAIGIHIEELRMSINRNTFRRFFVPAHIIGFFILMIILPPNLFANENKTMDLTAYFDEATSNIIMANELIRLTFHRGHPRFGTFPDGYTGYTLDSRNGNEWTPMASAPYFTALIYDSYWGRDFLEYALPKEYEIKKNSDSVNVTFTQDLQLGDWVAWQLTFSFTMTPGRPVVDVIHQAKVIRGRKVLLFWGPRIHAGAGSFGAEKDEAMFPGLEHLQEGDQSSDIWSLAPDIKLNYAPHPAKISIPLMTVLKDGHMTGIMWDPMQKWYKDLTCPTAVFASPNWIERKENHLMGLFVPSIPDYVAENSMKAYRPVEIDEGGVMTITAKLFAAPAKHAIDAIDLYLAEYGGLPGIKSRPMDDQAAMELLVRGLVECWNPEARGWPWTIGAPPQTNAKIISTLLKAKPLLKDEKLAARVDEMTTAALDKQIPVELDLALRIGGVEAILEDYQRRAKAMVATQNPDGSWEAKPEPIGEEGLAIWNAPPEPGYIGLKGERSQGITASSAAWLTGYVVLTNDKKTFKACLKGLKDMNRYELPYVNYNEECPQAVSLHGSYHGLRACLNAYRVTGEREWLDKAVYWAKTGVQFIYLWSLPPRKCETAHIHSNNPPLLEGGDLYEDITRDPMLYAALYGYGSSQFKHHWYGLPVQWIGLVYADDIFELARYDQSLDWKKMADGLCNSCLWMTYDRKPYTGYYPDGFSLITWMPSGPSISPCDLLRAWLHCKHGVGNECTVILRNGEDRYHVTSMAAIADGQADKECISFTLCDPGWNHCRAIVTDLPENPKVSVDGLLLPQVEDLEKCPEGWIRLPNDLVIIKVKQDTAPRAIRIGLPVSQCKYPSKSDPCLP